ncbi:hypothetical protein NQ318_001948, partial [Aromia moschata]
PKIRFVSGISDVACDIQCYKCLVGPPSFYVNETIRLCKDFDYSEKFIVNCPYSTFCMKRITSAKIPDLINGTERNCASQKFETQNYYNQKWHSEVIIEEPYKEGCEMVNDKGARTTTTEFCYCKGSLCNSASPDVPLAGAHFYRFGDIVNLRTLFTMDSLTKKA